MRQVMANCCFSHPQPDPAFWFSTPASEGKVLEREVAIASPSFRWWMPQ